MPDCETCQLVAQLRWTLQYTDCPRQGIRVGDYRFCTRIRGGRDCNDCRADSDASCLARCQDRLCTKENCPVKWEEEE